MWKRNKYFFIIAFSICGIWFIEYSKPKPINWFESYSKYDKIPFGNYILFNELHSIFTKSIETTNNTIEETLAKNVSATNYLIIDNSFPIRKRELKALLDFVHEGRNVCIISSSFSSVLLDTLGLKVKVTALNKIKESLSFSLTASNKIFIYSADNSYFVRSFDIDSVANCQKMGFISDSLINFIQITHGKGKLFLHLNPLLFTNYNMLTNNKHSYVSTVLSYLPNENLIWDEYYKNRKTAIVKSDLFYVLTVPGLQEAVYLSIFTILIYMLFASKRKQRIIPVIDKHSNDTLDFTRTIGQLYYNENDNKNIGMKRNAYFLAHIRKRFHLYSSEFNDDLSLQLHTVSNIEMEEIKKLVKICMIIQILPEISNDQIIQQDKQIENFYIKTNYHG